MKIMEMLCEFHMMCHLGMCLAEHIECKGAMRAMAVKRQEIVHRTRKFYKLFWDLF